VPKVKDGLPRWQDMGLPNIRYPETHMMRAAIQEVEASDSHEGAIAILEHHIGISEHKQEVSLDTPLWPLTIKRDNLPHIVEKRKDARERYVTMAIDTIKHPYEIWVAPYDDGLERYKFLGLYQQKYQMLVVVAPWDGRVLWNFMQTDLKSLNNHRCGKHLFVRP